MATKKPSLADVVRLGQTVATAKANTDKKTWRAVVKAAHARGVTVAGALSGGDPLLQARTQSSLQKQAEVETTKAYAPAFADLDTQEKGVNALADKRKADNAAFQEWVQVQSERLQGDARAADTALNSRLQTIHTDTQDAWKKTAEQAQLEAAPGRTSDAANSNALNSLGAAAAASNERMATARTAAVDGSSRSVDGMNVAAAALLASSAVNEAKRQGDQVEGLQKVTDARTKYKLEQVSDVAKSFTSLMAGEATKAQTRLETSIAADKLNVEQDKLDYTKIKDAKDYKLATKKVDLDKWIAENGTAADQAKIDLGYKQIKASQGKAAADAKLRKWIEKYDKTHAQAENPADPDKVTPAEKTASSVLYRSANTIKGQLVDLHTRFPSGKSKGGQSFRQILRSRHYDDVMIDIAEDLRVHDGHLSPAGIAKARNAGIIHPETLWPAA